MTAGQLYAVGLVLFLNLGVGFFSNQQTVPVSLTDVTVQFGLPREIVVS